MADLPDGRRPDPDVPPPPPGAWPLAPAPPADRGGDGAGGMPEPSTSGLGGPVRGAGLGLASAAIAVYLAMQLVVQLVVGIVALGLDLLDPALLEPGAGGAGLLTLVVASQVAGLGAAVLLVRRRGLVLSTVVGPVRPLARHVGIGIGLGVVALLGSTLLVTLLVTLTGSDATPQQVLTEQLLGSPLELTLAALAAVVMAPLAEELLFRGLLHRALRARLRMVGATLVSSVLFAIVHVDVAASQPLGLVGLTLVGVVLAIAYERTGSLLVPIVIHATHNGLTILAVVATSRLDPDLLPAVLGPLSGG